MNKIFICPSPLKPFNILVIVSIMKRLHSKIFSQLKARVCFSLY
ncbi:hypothetical protein OCHUTO_0380 [Orientia chuto str. Dubai]|uniref:Uncharacterized protein n=1 Tax=Orientia chuto str. Dubai TaxID=1359168 RepID=A0A0F3MMJ4_9RICK|nr:hypothetical protein OCHUTO_0380 [Orientia chuto str. Dubai]